MSNSLNRPKSADSLPYLTITFDQEVMTAFGEQGIQAITNRIHDYASKYKLLRDNLRISFINQPANVERAGTELLTLETASPGQINLVKETLIGPEETIDTIIHALPHALKPDQPTSIGSPIQYERNANIVGAHGFVLEVLKNGENKKIWVIEEAAAEFLAINFRNRYVPNDISYTIVFELFHTLATAVGLTAEEVALYLQHNGLINLLNRICETEQINHIQLVMVVDTFARAFNLIDLNNDQRAAEVERLERLREKTTAANQSRGINRAWRNYRKRGIPLLANSIAEELMADVRDQQLISTIQQLIVSYNDPYSPQEQAQWAAKVATSVPRKGKPINIANINAELDDAMNNPQMVLAEHTNSEKLRKAFMHMISRAAAPEIYSNLTTSFIEQLEHEIEHVELILQRVTELQEQHPWLDLQPQIGFYFVQGEQSLGFQMFVLPGRVDENMTTEIYLDIWEAALQTTEQSDVDAIQLDGFEARSDSDEG